MHAVIVAVAPLAIAGNCAVTAATPLVFVAELAALSVTPLLALVQSTVTPLAGAPLFVTIAASGHATATFCATHKFGTSAAITSPVVATALKVALTVAPFASDAAIVTLPAAVGVTLVVATPLLDAVTAHGLAPHAPNVALPLVTLNVTCAEPSGTPFVPCACTAKAVAAVAPTFTFPVGADKRTSVSFAAAP
jgi:hypothetical protein